MKKPKDMTLRQWINWQVENDPITIADRETMYRKWGIVWKPKRRR